MELSQRRTTALGQTRGKRSSSLVSGALRRSSAAPTSSADTSEQEQSLATTRNDNDIDDDDEDEQSRELAKQLLLNPPPSTLPMLLLTLFAIIVIITPLAIIYRRLPSPDLGDFADHASPRYPTRSVTDHPFEGVHFQRGELHPEGRALGPEDSERWVVEFTDFFCHHCQEMHRDVLDPLLHQYVPKNMLRIESHPIAFLDDDSMRAAHAALCAQEQHKYWEVRELLFKVNVTTKRDQLSKAASSSSASSSPGSKDPIPSAFSGTVLRQIALTAKLDFKAFTECFKSARHVEEIKSLTAFARDLGIKETPTLLVGDETLTGVVPLARVKELLRLPT